MNLEIWDSPDSASVAVDAIMYCKLATDRGLSGPLVAPSSHSMKSPPIQYASEETCRMATESVAGSEW